MRDARPRFDVRVEAPRVRARIEEGGYAADTELAVAAVAFAEESLPCVTGITRHEGELYSQSPDCLTVVYPDGGDTLWSVAERYHKSPARLAERNGIPLHEPADAALATSLDGVAYLIVE